MAGHVQALQEVLDRDEPVRHIAMARLDNPTLLDLVEGLHDPPKLVGKGAAALNEALGGVLAVTDRRLLYLARTLIGRQQLERGNELLGIPLSRIRAARCKRGVGVGDVRKIASLTLFGSKLWVAMDMGEILFLEIKPLDAAAQIARAIPH